MSKIVLDRSQNIAWVSQVKLLFVTDSVCADVKEHPGLRRLSGHGLVRVRTEFALEVLLHNLLVVQRSLEQKSDAEGNSCMTEQTVA